MRVKKKTHPLLDMNSEALKEFRQATYDLLVKAKDATFELMDAVMTTRNAACLGATFSGEASPEKLASEFALSPLFTRRWSSIYEALQDSRPDRKKLMVLYIKQLEQQVPAEEYALVAIDHTAWG
jgi:hypothetical protein